MSFSAGKNLENNVNTTEAQTLYKKTLLGDTNTIDGANIDNCTITNASIVSPDKLQMKSYADLATAQADLANRSGGELVYVADIKKTYQVNDDGLGTKTLAEISGGQGGVNYIENSDFEQGVDGYVESGLNFTIDQTKVAGEVLRGEASAKLSKVAVDATGAEISVPFTVPRADLAKKLTVSFEYDASDAAYSDDDIQVYVKQDPNGTPSVIRINGEDLKGGKGTHYAQFQTDASQTEYELVFKVNSANASAYDVIIDDVKVGPRELAKGTIVTDWKDFTPTGTWTSGTNYSGKYRRVGDSVELQYYLELIGTPNATTLRLDFPDSLILDESKINQNVLYSNELGTGVIYGGGSYYACQGLYDNSLKNILVSFNFDQTGSASNPVRVTGVTNSAPVTFASGDTVQVTVSLPIQGWSSNTVMSEDLGGREIYTKVSLTSNQTITNGTTTILQFNNVNRDSSNAADISNYRINILETGYYDVNAGVLFSTLNDGAQIQCGITRNGTTIARVRTNQSGTLYQESVNVNTTDYFEKGDYVDVRVYHTSGVDETVTANVETFLIVKKNNSPQTILETETVAARYTSNSGQSLSPTTIFAYEDIDNDTHNAYDTLTGLYTVPVSGWYMVEASIQTQSFSASASAIAIKVDNNYISQGRDGESTNVTKIFDVRVVSFIYLNKGQEVGVENIVGAPSLSLDGYKNTFSIARIK